MKYPRLRMKTLFMYLNWFTSSFILYGIALNWQALTGGLFLNFAIAAALDFPAVSARIPTLHFSERVEWVVRRRYLQI